MIYFWNAMIYYIVLFSNVLTVSKRHSMKIAISGPPPTPDIFVSFRSYFFPLVKFHRFDLTNDSSNIIFRSSACDTYESPVCLQKKKNKRKTRYYENVQTRSAYNNCYNVDDDHLLY